MIGPLVGEGLGLAAPSSRDHGPCRTRHRRGLSGFQDRGLNSADLRGRCDQQQSGHEFGTVRCSHERRSARVASLLLAHCGEVAWHDLNKRVARAQDPLGVGEGTLEVRGGPDCLALAQEKAPARPSRLAVVSVSASGRVPVAAGLGVPTFVGVPPGITGLSARRPGSPSRALVAALGLATVGSTVLVSAVTWIAAGLAAACAGR